MLGIFIVVFTTILVIKTSKTSNANIQKILNWLPAILLAYVIPAILSVLLNVDYSAHELHQWSKNFIIPFTILAVMSSLSIHQLKSCGWKPIVVFVAGSFFIALFPILLFGIAKLNPLLMEWLITGEKWKGLVTIIGSWVGGSTSQLVLKEAVETPESVFLAILIFDNLIVNLWTIFMFQFIKKSGKINDQLGINDQTMPEQIVTVKDNPIHPMLAVLLMFILVMLNFYFVPVFIYQILILSIIGLMLSNFWPPWNETFALKIGGVLIIIVMAILGLKLKFSNLSFDYILIGILLIWILGHLIFTMIIARILNVHMAWVAIGSMANVGGIATAPAVTSAYKKEWMPHAVLLAVLSMATGTFWGLMTIGIIKSIL
jgi:uncharacterized membrane protein